MTIAFCTPCVSPGCFVYLSVFVCLSVCLCLFFCLFVCDCSAHLEPRVGPGAKLHLTVLVIKGEPCDVNLRKHCIKVMHILYNKELGMFYFDLKYQFSRMWSISSIQNLLIRSIKLLVGHLTSRLEDARRNIEHGSVTWNNNVRLVSPVEPFVSAAIHFNLIN